MTFFYTTRLKHSDSSEYSEFYIDIVNGKDPRSGTITIEWQTHNDNYSKDAPWYCGRCLFKSGMYSDSTAIANKLPKIYKSIQSHLSRNPIGVLGELDRQGVKRMIFDHRLDDYVSPNNVPSQNYFRYIDDRDAIGYRYTTVAVVARTEKEARDKIIASIEGEEYSARLRFLSDWSSKGMPVVKMDVPFPDTRTPQEQLEFWKNE